MLKKLTCFILCLVTCASLTSNIVFAQDTDINYTDKEKEFIHLKYTNQEPMLKALFENTSAVGYWKMIKQIEENKALSGSLHISSWIIGELPKKKDYAEILANLIAMQEGDFAEQIETQSRFDNLKNGGNYVSDIVDIADSFIGWKGLLGDISPIISAAVDGKDTLIENIEEAKYYEITIQSYIQANSFLEAVRKYAKNKELLSDKNPDEITESWYKGQVDVLTRYFDILNNMFNVKEDVDIPTDMNSHQGSQKPIRTTSDERDIVLVLDTSGSMSGTPLEETKKASVKFVNTILEEDASIGVVTYDDKAEQLSDFSVNKNHLRQIVTGISDGGGTNIGDGLARAKSMLDKSRAKKKMIVLMSDGEPNQGKEGEELIAYANELKSSGIYVYTLGFFEDMGDKKSSAQYLMEEIASDGCHYEVANADDLVFFFEDIADQINGQKYIYVRIACPVDVSVTYKGETLNSSEKNPTLRTKFGTLTFEENQSTSSQGEEDKVKVLRLKEGVDYDIQIAGTGHGIMDYTIGFMDENGEYSDFRKFENIKITKRTMIDTVAADSDESVLKIDEDGDGKYDLKLSAKENGYGKEVKTRTWIYIVIGSGVLLLVIDLFITLKMRKKRKAR